MRKLLFCLLLIASGLSAATNLRHAPVPREYNPFLAGTLSWYSAGLGQIYTGDYFKGAVFLAIDSTLLYMAINAIADINVSINENIGLGLNVSLRKDNKRYDLNGAFFLVAFLTFHFYNVFDAVLTSASKNRTLMESQDSLGAGDPAPEGLVDMPLYRRKF